MGGLRAVWLLGFVLVVGVSCAGRPALPVVPAETLRDRLPPLPSGVAPVYEWTAEAGPVYSYWGVQHFTLRARGAFPDDPALPDGAWTLDVRSRDGVSLRSIGIERRYITPEGKTEALLVPELDFAALPDGLYVLLLPGLRREGGRLHSVLPTAVLCEVRGGVLKPFRFPIPLIPVQPSSFTPAPAKAPPRPAGTPIHISPVD